MSLHVDAAFLLGILNITLIDIALSGDNAIVIGMAASSLPKEKRGLVIAAGGALAIALRVILTLGASLLMLLPYVSAVGALVLVWIVYRLLVIASPGESGERRSGTATGPRRAMLYIVAADLTMSLDNVIAVAGAAKGSLFLLVAGLLISMPLLMTAGGFISLLIDRARWLIYLGAAAISYTAAGMLFADRALRLSLTLARPWTTVLSIAFALIAPLGFHLFGRRRSRHRPASTGGAGLTDTGGAGDEKPH